MGYERKGRSLKPSLSLVKPTRRRSKPNLVDCIAGVNEYGRGGRGERKPLTLPIFLALLTPFPFFLRLSHTQAKANPKMRNSVQALYTTHYFHIVHSALCFPPKILRFPPFDCKTCF